MSMLRFPGLQTGIDTSAIIEQLMTLERRTMNTYEQRKSTWEQKLDALGTLETKIRTLRNDATALSDADELKAYQVSTSDDEKVTASASNNAYEGNHTIVINQLAAAERWVHNTGKEYLEDLVGAGTFIYSYGNEETSITTTATTTLEDMVGLINNDANNPGVTASTLYYNGRYHLVLNGQDGGTDYRISVNNSNTEVWQSDSELTVASDNASLTSKIVDLDQFGENSLEGGEVIEITGTDRYGNAITQVDLSLTANTRVEHLIGEINDAFAGIAKARFENGKIVLTENTAGASDLSITLTYNANGSAATLTLPAMAVNAEGGSTSATLSDYSNDDFTVTQTAQNAKIKVDGFPNTSAISEVQRITPSVNPSSGTFTLTYNGMTTSAIAYDASAATVQAALEALSNVNSGDITVSAQNTNLSDGYIEFTYDDALGDVNLISIDPSNLDQSSMSNYAVTEETQGNGGYISRSSNTIDDVISGVTLHLHDTTDASGEEITLTRDIESVKTKLNEFIVSYNAATEYIKEKIGFNNVTETAGILIGDYVVSTMRYKFREPIIEQTKGFLEDFDTFLMPGQIGIEVDRDGMLSLNENDFEEAIAEDYKGVLDIIGADKTGSSSSKTINFYNASSSYTTAGTYNVQVTIMSNQITDAQIKLSSESSYRTMDFSASGNIITGNSEFDSNGDPVYAENGLQLTVDSSVADGTYTASIYVKQGFTGAIKDVLDKIVESEVGSLEIDQEQVQSQIDELEEKIEDEEYRLEVKEKRLVTQFARLEKTLALLQQQMGAVNSLGSVV